MSEAFVESFKLDEDGFCCTRVFVEPEIWRVELAMEATFLPSVNVFVVRDGHDSLIVDAGTSDALNDTRLMRALLGLGIEPERTTLFCTHAHNDHTGLARELSEAGVTILVSEGTHDDMERFAAPRYRTYLIDRLTSEGVSVSEAAELADSIWTHTVSFVAEGVRYRTIPAGSAIVCGRWTFEAIPTPGHTPGQCALWLPERRLAFLGDAVLFICSTCICFWQTDPDTIGNQLATLDRLATLGIDHAFLGHGLQQGEVGELCLKNSAHHVRRSERALKAVAEGPGRTAFELIGSLGWHARADQWTKLPALTRWFLASESIAHLDHLVATNKIARVSGRYYPV